MFANFARKHRWRKCVVWPYLDGDNTNRANLKHIACESISLTARVLAHRARVLLTIRQFYFHPDCHSWGDGRTDKPVNGVQAESGSDLTINTFYSRYRKLLYKKWNYKLPKSLEAWIFISISVHSSQTSLNTIYFFCSETWNNYEASGSKETKFFGA